MNWHVTSVVLAGACGIAACWTAPGIVFSDNPRLCFVATVVLVILAALFAGGAAQ